MNSPTEFPRVTVVWIDAVLHYNFEGNPEETPHLAIMNRTGYLIGKRKDPNVNMWYIVLACEKLSDDNHVREPMCIPACLVKDIKYLEESKRAIQKSKATAKVSRNGSTRRNQSRNRGRVRRRK